MLAEFLEDQGKLCQIILPGVSVYQFSLPKLEVQMPHLLSPELRPFCLEILFCRGGALSIHSPEQPPISIREQEILIYSDDTAFDQVKIQGALNGFLLSVHTKEVHAGMQTMSQILGGSDQFFHQIQAVLSHHKGCCRIRSTPWTRVIFPILEALPPEEQGRYCVMKSMELMYLLCTYHSLLEQPSDFSMSWGYLSKIVSEMRDYMEQHLDEKLTITFMSRQFHISPTAFKRCFRSLYGQPIHNWLQGKRMQKAAEFLSTSPMTVLQVAQSVGYEGVSQFNVMFKRQYGVTPSQYRKMSVSGSF